MNQHSCTPSRAMTQQLRGMTPTPGGIELQDSIGHLIFKDNPFSGLPGNYQVLPFKEGSTVNEIVQLACIDNSWLINYLQVTIGDQIIPRESWHLVRLKKTAPITLMVIPQGGGGGDILKVVAIVAIAVVAAVVIGPAAAGLMGFTAGTTSFAVAASLSAMAFSMAASLAINAVFPPPAASMPSLGTSSGSGSGSGSSEAETFSWSSTNNANLQYQPVPRVYGRVKMAPPYASRPYVETIGDQSYLYMIFDFGYGPLKIEDMRVGENALDTFQNLEYKIHPAFKKGDSLSIFNRDVYQESYSQKLIQGGWRTATSTIDCIEFVMDFNFPQGLAKVNSTNGNVEGWSVDLAVEYRPASGGNWSAFDRVPYELIGPCRVFVADENFPSYWQSTSGEYEGAPNYAEYTAFPSPLDFPDGQRITYLTYRDDSYYDDEYGYIRKSTAVYSDYVKNVTNAQVTKKIRVENAKQRPFSASLRMLLPAGEYEFRSTRLTQDSNDRYISDDVYLSSLRSVKNITPIAPEVPHTIIEMKVLATDQLNGVFNNFTAVATSILNVWNGSSLVQAETRNPAWAYLDVLIGTAAIYPAQLSRVDLASIKEWADWCDAPSSNSGGLPKSQCDMVISGDYTAWQVLKMVAGTGDGTASLRSGQYSVSIDRPKAYPVQMFTPRNSSGFISSINYYDHPQALRVQFVDPTQEWQSREIIVYDDGQNESNTTKFQSMQLVGITNYHQAYRIGRRSLAQGKLRRESFSISVGMENILATRGDLVRLAYDIPKIGVGWARVKSITGTTIQFDDEMALIKQGDYLRARVSDILQIDLKVADVLSIDTVIVSGDLSKLMVGDLCVYGEISKITMDCIVKTIQPGADLSAQVDLVPYAPGIYTAESQPIPPYDPLISNLDDRRPGPVVGLYAAEVTAVINRYHYISIALTWTKPSGVPPIGYAIYELRSGQWEQIGTTKELNFYAYKDVRVVSDGGLPIELIGKNLSFAVVAVGAGGRRISVNVAPIASITPVGDIIGPRPVKWFLNNVQDMNIALSWGPPDDNDIGNYLIRYSPLVIGASWNASQLIGEFAHDVTRTMVGARAGTYMIRVEDTTGNLSEISYRRTTIEQLPNINLIARVNDAPDWDGTLSGCHLQDGGVELDGEWGNVNPEGIYFYKDIFDAGYVYELRIASKIQTHGVQKSDLMANWIPLASMKSMTSVSAYSFNAMLEVRTADDVSFIKDWTPLASAIPLNNANDSGWSPWRPCEVGDFTGRLFQFRILLNSYDPNVKVIIDDGLIEIDARDRIDSYKDLAVTSAGLDVNFDPAFMDIPTLAITTENSLAVKYKVTNKTRTGFRVQLFDEANTPVNGQIDAMALGYGKQKQSSI